MEERKVGYMIGAIVATLLILWCQAWFMTVIFSWFNLYLTIWQAIGIVVLIKSITMVVNDK
jgi:hypothetical protein